MHSVRFKAIEDSGGASTGGSLFHIVYTVVVCLTGIVLPLIFAKHITPVQWLTIIPTFCIANFIEYAVHRWVMHRHIPQLLFVLKLHMIHHNYFNEDEYYLRKFPDFQMVVFPPVVLNVVLFAVTLPLAYVAYLIAGKNVGLLFIATVMAYYLLMQILHVAAHSAGLRDAK